eukprot:13297197-Heterocapsa_arctica.AAC.1
MLRERRLPPAAPCARVSAWPPRQRTSRLPRRTSSCSSGRQTSWPARVRLWRRPLRLGRSRLRRPTTL